MNTNPLDNRELRIVFMGTPDFAVATLDLLVQSPFQVVGVITAADKPAGRGRTLRESAVKKYAVANTIPVLQPTNLKSEAFLEALKALNANLQIVVAFRMLPRVVWEMPKYGTFNLHASLLPNYRGAAPINWAIMNGETETGVTTFFIDDKIDTGEIILQKQIDISLEDTAGTLHDKLMALGAVLVLETVKRIKDNSVTTQKQTAHIKLRTAHKIHKDTCKIDWERPLKEIYDHIRGLSPYPAAWTYLYNASEPLFLKIYSVRMEEEEHTLKEGSLLHTKNEMKVAVKGGFLNLLEIQLPGKRRMKTREILNGLKLAPSAYIS
ncbi:methionyl-tRNA formyltransferase [Spongiimicrobium sp. 3-5]|uniref:methionyl-tRNA formyltransferase n=1 Tax=Spongiimicrobium sp. 3-5 TaxID=3332596 RepID=UPI0039806A0D